jgi:Phasin protein
MRIPLNQVLFLGQRQWPEFVCPQEPLPDEIRILLWLMDGAERRHRLAFRWSGKEPCGTYPMVSFDDFAHEPSNPEISGSQEFWPEAVLSDFERTFEAAAQGALLLHREMIDIAQRNVNASFSLLRRLAGVKDLGEIVDLQAAYWRNQLVAFTGQIDELSALSRNAARDMVDALS